MDFNKLRSYIRGANLNESAITDMYSDWGWFIGGKKEPKKFQKEFESDSATEKFVVQKNAVRYAFSKRPETLTLVGSKKAFIQYEDMILDLKPTGEIYVSVVDLNKEMSFDLMQLKRWLETIRTHG